jgi:predicted thioredoxin/glutaredoxin
MIIYTQMGRFSSIEETTQKIENRQQWQDSQIDFIKAESSEELVSIATNFEYLLEYSNRYCKNVTVSFAGHLYWYGKKGGIALDNTQFRSKKGFKNWLISQS